MAASDGGIPTQRETQVPPRARDRAEPRRPVGRRLTERIGLLRAEIERLERAIGARKATRAAAHSAFKT